MLKGQKVLLREIRKDDYDTLGRFRRDFEVHVLADDDPFIPHSLAYWDKWYEKHLKEPDRKNVVFAIEAEGKLIGTCGLFSLDVTNQHGALGIAIGDRDYWSRGYGRDAVKLLVDYGFLQRNLHHITLEVLATNERGIHAYRAAGFVEEGRYREHAWVSGEWVDSVAMGIVRSDWESSGNGSEPPSRS